MVISREVINTRLRRLEKSLYRLDDLREFAEHISVFLEKEAAR